MLILIPIHKFRIQMFEFFTTPPMNESRLLLLYNVPFPFPHPLYRQLERTGNRQLVSKILRNVDHVKYYTYISLRYLFCADTTRPERPSVSNIVRKREYKSCFATIKSIFETCDNSSKCLAKCNTDRLKTDNRLYHSLCMHDAI